MICELPDYITDALDEFVFHYGSLEEVYEHKDEIYYYPDCADMTDVAYYFIDYVAKHGKKYTFELAVSFAKDKSGGVKVTYKNEISIKENGGWRYKYGNMFYVRLVNQYLAVPSFSDATAQAIFKEALKYQGWKYVFGGSNPNTSFDCSGLTSWCYGKAGISLPRTAQAQYV